jgi:type I restriction enzyme R subunit
MITEDQLEQLAIQWFQDTGWNYVHGAVIAPEAEPSSQPSPTERRSTAEREDFRAGVLKGRLAEAVRRSAQGSVPMRPRGLSLPGNGGLSLPGNAAQGSVPTGEDGQSVFFPIQPDSPPTPFEDPASFT